MRYRRLVSGLSPARATRATADVDFEAMTDELRAEKKRGAHLGGFLITNDYDLGDFLITND